MNIIPMPRFWKVCSHAPEDLATAIRHAKNYEMTIEETNHTKLINSQKKLKTTLQTNNNSSNNYQDINHHNNAIKTILDHHLTTNFKIVIIVESQNTENEITENCKKTNKTGTTKSKQLLSTSFIINVVTISTNFTNSAISNIIHSTITNTSQKIGEVAVPRTNPSNNTIPPAQIAQNANLSDTFSFEFEANKSPFLLSNAAVNKQKAITAIYTEATVEGKPI
ncbi:hypothetical protein G9A89_015505 [Geosiphon pyriformis]|nr:hypothetical protein G9A89_015505 [Geosiphon pyriformis]